MNSGAGPDLLILAAVLIIFTAGMWGDAATVLHRTTDPACFYHDPERWPRWWRDRQRGKTCAACAPYRAWVWDEYKVNAGIAFVNRRGLIVPASLRPPKWWQR